MPLPLLVIHYNTSKIVIVLEEMILQYSLESSTSPTILGSFSKNINSSELYQQPALAYSGLGCNSMSLLVAFTRKLERKSQLPQFIMETMTAKLNLPFENMGRRIHY